MPSAVTRVARGPAGVSRKRTDVCTRRSRSARGADLPPVSLMACLVVLAAIARRRPPLSVVASPLGRLTGRPAPYPRLKGHCKSKRDRPRGHSLLNAEPGLVAARTDARQIATHARWHLYLRCIAGVGRSLGL